MLVRVSSSSPGSLAGAAPASNLPADARALTGPGSRFLGSGGRRQAPRAAGGRKRKPARLGRDAPASARPHRSSRYAATNGKTMVASDSMMKRGVSTSSLPQVIFSPGGAPLYEPYEVVESEIWAK